MKIYNYQYQSKNSNATIIITVLSDKGRDVADLIAEDELGLAFTAEPSSWYVEEVSEEAY